MTPLREMIQQNLEASAFGYMMYGLRDRSLNQVYNIEPKVCRWWDRKCQEDLDAALEYWLLVREAGE